MLLPFQGAGMAACVFPRVSLRLPWAMCWLGFQPALWRGGCGMGAWVRVLDVCLSRVVALLCFCPFRAQDWRRASFPGCRFAYPGLCAGWAFSPPCDAGFTGWGHGCGHRTCVFSVLSLCYAFALSGRRIGGVRLSQGVASLALDYVLVGLSARLVVRGLRDGAWVWASDVQRKILPARAVCRVGRIVVSVSPSVGRMAYLPIIFSVRVVPSASVTRTSTACGAERDAALYSAVCAPPTRSVPPTCLPSAV